MGERVAVVGATGYTGGVVVQELVGRGVEVVAVGRNPAKLDALPAEVERHVADVTDRVALAGSLDGCGAVANCVGSFVDFGEAVVGAAIAARVPYVDTTGEFPFLRRVFEIHDAPARQAGVAVVPGMAFYSAPADLAAALAAEALGRPPETVEIGYHLAGARPSRGTLRTNLRRAGQPCEVWEDGRLVSRRTGDDPRPFRFPEPDGTTTVARWPGAEVLGVPRHTGARSVAVYVAMPKAAAAVFRNPRLTALLQPVGRALVGTKTGGPSAEARARARYAVVVEARAGSDATRCVVEGRDMYGVTAAACAEAALRLTAVGLTAGGERRSGALAPAEAFDPTDFLNSLAGYLTWRIEQ
ncbi:MAG TPA: NAD(P)H-binding protein [Acidimicrobiia bacterium]|nr:NAD(P)H-binding protein [Acidimicrobiia bacterium]